MDDTTFFVVSVVVCEGLYSRNYFIFVFARLEMHKKNLSALIFAIFA